jgi:hypothetical protein
MGFDVFSSRSSGFMTGTEGKVTYRFDNHKLAIHWINPFVGGNETHCLIDPEQPDFRAVSITGNGNHGAHMRFVIATRPAQLSSPDWRTCVHCKTLVFALDEGRCAARPRGVQSAPSRALRDLIQGRPSGPVEPEAGTEQFGAHEAAGYTFRLPFGVVGPNRQPGWRKCQHCKALFHDGGQARGSCPGRRGGHEPEAEGIDFGLAYGRPPGPSQQDNWRFCGKCRALFYLPHNADGACPGGGTHHAQSESYVLDLNP